MAKTNVKFWVYSIAILMLQQNGEIMWGYKISNFLNIAIAIMNSSLRLASLRSSEKQTTIADKKRK